MLASLLSLAVLAVTLTPIPSAAGPSHQTPEQVVLWPGGAPGALGVGDADIPSMAIYRPAAGTANGGAIVVCPGGGYGVLAAHEGEPIARWLNTLGVTAAVLKYRLGPKYHHPVMLQDVGRAIRTMRARSGEWGLDPKRIGVLGFSAGGHLASTAETHFDVGNPAATDPIDRASSRPDVAVLVYAVITMESPFTHAGSRENLLGRNPSPALVELLSNEKQVTADTPPTFLICSDEDTAVPAENSLQFALALRKAKVPVELHMYERGPHGFGLGGSDPVLGGWPEQCAKWLRVRGMLGGGPGR